MENGSNFVKDFWRKLLPPMGPNPPQPGEKPVQKPELVNAIYGQREDQPEHTKRGV